MLSTKRSANNAGPSHSQPIYTAYFIHSPLKMEWQATNEYQLNREVKILLEGAQMSSWKEAGSALYFNAAKTQPIAFALSKASPALKDSLSERYSI